MENAENAKSVIRKYFLGTRTFHGKITSLIIEKVDGPDDKGTWKVKGSYNTEASGEEIFTASVSSRGEVRVTSSVKPKPR